MYMFFFIFNQRPENFTKVHINGPKSLKSVQSIVLDVYIGKFNTSLEPVRAYMKSTPPPGSLCHM